MGVSRNLTVTTQMVSKKATRISRVVSFSFSPALPSGATNKQWEFHSCDSAIPPTLKKGNKGPSLTSLDRESCQEAGNCEFA